MADNVQIAELTPAESLTSKTDVQVGDKFLVFGADNEIKAAEAYPSSTKRPYVLLFLGQSNARGHETSTGGDMRKSPGVLVWDGDETQEGTTFNVVSADGEYPFDTYNSGEAAYANSMPYSMARSIHERTGRPVYLILYAAGSHPIEAFILPATRTANSWTLDTGTYTDLTTYMYDGIATALAAVPGAPTQVDAIGWMQGEANKSDAANDYWDKLENGVIGDLNTAGFIDADATRIVIGGLIDHPQLNPFRTYHAEVAFQLRVNWPLASFVCADGLSLESGGSQHFTGAGLVTMGESMAASATNPMDMTPQFVVDGTWTPVIADASSGGNEATASSAVGQYTLVRTLVRDEGTNRFLGIGGNCKFTMRMVDIDTTGLTAGNDVFLTGLPFPSRNGTAGTTFAACEAERVTFGDLLTARIINATTYAKFRKNTSAAADADLLVSDLDSGFSDIAFSLEYPLLIDTFSDGTTAS